MEGQPHNIRYNALIISEDDCASNIIQQYKYDITTFHPRAVSTASTQHIDVQIKQGKFDLVWIELPSNGRALPPNKRAPRIRQFTTWIRQAQTVGKKAVLISLRGRHWQEENIQALLSDKVTQEATYCLCAMNLKVNNDTALPSAIQLHAHATFAITPLRCKCNKDQEHIYELKGMDAGRASTWLSTKAKAYTKLAFAWLGGNHSSLVHQGNCGTITTFSVPDSDRNIDQSKNKNNDYYTDDLRGDCLQAYPTTAKENAKLQKKAGHVAKKKIKIVEDHYDDLGADLSGLGPSIKIYMLDVCSEAVSYQPDEAEDFCHNLMVWFPMGANEPSPMEGVFHQSAFECSFETLFQSGSGVDICELCGGAGRPSILAIRRRLNTGKNFDFVTGFDLGNRSHQNQIKHYITTNKVLVVTMAPSCRSLGPPSNINRIINYDTWLIHYKEDQPHIHFCAQIALLQIRVLRFFFGENPWPTYLFNEGEWPQVMNHKTVMTIIIHQCRLGLKGPAGLPIKKPTVLVSNGRILLEQFTNLQCRNDHQHDQTWGNGKLLHSLQVWPWGLAERLVNGIVALIKQLKQTNNYPELGTGHQDDNVQDDETQPWMKCPGCKGRMARTRREHTRIRGECKWPDVEPEAEWTCPGCSRTPPRARGHQDHTEIPGECRWGYKGTRNVASRARGSHPREATRRATADPSHDVPGPELNPTPARDSQPLGDDDPPNIGGPSSSSNGPSNARVEEPGPVDIPDHDEPSQRRSRGPDTTQRLRRSQPTIAERSAGDGSSDWTSFDITTSLRILRTGTEVQRKNELRKLHIRWWHAPRASMEKILRAAGLPTQVLSMIPQVIDTCRECRAWMKNGPSITPSPNMITETNHKVEADILFYRTYMAFHLVDRADRWHAAVEVKSKTTPSLCDAISVAWISIHGPFKFLVIDGERGLNCDEAKAYLNTHGIQLKPRAPGQHAQIIERRGAILRHSMHLIEEQLAKEGITISFTRLLAEAVFAGNSLVSYGGATPYNARFGRQPQMLPDLEAPPDTTAPGTARSTHRIREVALQKIIESSALARINRALRSHSTVPGEVHNYQPGDLIEFYRPPNNKDASGWLGPARVIQNLPQRGQVQCKHNHGEIWVRYPDARRSLEFMTFTYLTTEDAYTAVGQATATMTRLIRAMHNNTITTIGYVKPKMVWTRTTATTTQRALTLAIQHVVNNILHYPTTFAVRAGRGISRFPVCSEADFTVLVYWDKTFDNCQIFEADNGHQIVVKTLVGECWSNYLYLQLLCSREAEPEFTLKDSIVPDETEEATSDAATASESPPQDPERLSTIAEETQDDTNEVDDDIFLAINSEYFDKDLETHETISLVAERYTDDRVVSHEALHYHTADASLDDLNKCNEFDTDSNPYVEILFPEHTAKLILDEEPPLGTCARLCVYPAGIKKAIISTDTDLLTNDDYHKYAKEVAASIKEELTIWIEHRCFSRRSRKGARNILDVKWVGKWKKVKSKLDPTVMVRIIRMRLTLRGFKDMDANEIPTYAGTSSRLSQKLLVSEAVNNGWPIVALDVSKAFLKGISYEELASKTGEPERDVNFELDSDAVAILRTLPGYEDFDPRVEVLHCDKPGTGCKDAPRAWSIQLTKATNEDFGLKSTTYDEQLVVRHTKENKLDCIGTKHVDDVKAAGPANVLAALIAVLEKHFGKGQIDITWNTFKSCGLQHTPFHSGYVLDQCEYIKALKPIQHPELISTKNTDEAPATLASLFLSLLMALAFSLQTRSDLCVYVVNLQRYAQKPKGIHVRRLNAIVRYAQANERKLTYWRLTGILILEVHTDAGFRKEVDETGHCDGKALRGANFILRQATLAMRNTVHLLDVTVGMLKQVTRSTFTSEGGALILAADQAIVLRHTLVEIKTGPQKLSMGNSSAMIQTTGGYYPIVLVTDAYNILLSIDTPHVKPPAEKSFMLNLLWLKQQLELAAVHALQWGDTRDMTADGHTKGSISRQAIDELISGILCQSYNRRSISFENRVDSLGKRMVEVIINKRAQTGGEMAQHGRGPMTSANEDADGPMETAPGYADTKEFLFSGLPDDPFEILGLQLCREEALQMTEEEIRSAYRSASRHCHPDKCKDQKEAHEKFTKLSDAAETLTTAWQDTTSKKHIIGQYLATRRHMQGLIASRKSRQLQDKLNQHGAQVMLPHERQSNDAEVPQYKTHNGKIVVAPGMYLLQQTLKSALFQRSTGKVNGRMQSTSETRITGATAHTALKAFNTTPARINALGNYSQAINPETGEATALAPKHTEEQKAEQQKEIRRALIHNRITRRETALLAKHKAEKQVAKKDGVKFSGNTLWRIKSLRQRWARAARLRHDISDNQMRRCLNPAESQQKLKRPDERVADARAWTKYHRESAEWKPPERRTIRTREYRPGYDQRRHVKQRKRYWKGRPTILEITDGTPTTHEQKADTTAATTTITTAPTTTDHHKRQDKKRRHRQQAAVPAPLPMPVTPGRMTKA